MKLLQMPRVPEPELMDEAAEVEAYASAAAQAYLEAIDRTFVQHLARLFPSPEPYAVRGTLLDVGCGPGQIVIKMARRWPGLKITAIDAAPHMIEQARGSARAANVEVDLRVVRAAGNSRLPFPDASFDVVTCNSVLHHLAEPKALLDEIGRLARPEGAVLVRDLRRPLRPLFSLHVKFFGRKYAGEMRRLYEASVRAAYTPGEIKRMLAASRLNGGRTRVFTHGLTHLGIERAMERPAPSPNPRHA